MFSVHIFWIALVMGWVWCEEICPVSELDGVPCPYEAFPDPGCFPEGKFPSGKSMGTAVVPIDNHKYPYIVSLQTLKCGKHDLGSGCYEHFCGGTMIATHLLLTAAHCFDDYKNREASVRADGLEFYTLNQPIFAAISPKCRHLQNEKYGRFQVNSVVIHPKYQDQFKYSNDVAILDIFSQNGEFYDGPVVEIITEDSKEDVSNAWVVGYGEFNPNDVNKYVVRRLHGALLQAREEEDCKELLGEFDSVSNITLNYTNMMCYWELNADSCEGDSGGPLILDNKDIQIGIVSWGPGGACSNVDVMQAPGVYVRLTLFANWIQEIIKKFSIGEPQIPAPVPSTTSAPSPLEVSSEPSPVNIPTEEKPSPTITPSSSEIAIEELEANALLTFKNGMRNSTILKSWNGSNACNNWLGISCTNNRVSNISLGGNIWQINNEIYTFDNSIPLTKNIQTGMPDQRSVMEQLEIIQLANMGITGSLPAFISQFENLKVFDVVEGNIQGALPPQYSALVSLAVINVGFNDITGSFPVEYSMLSKLQKFQVNYNQLTGTLPPEYSTLVSMQDFNAAQNSIKGSVPGEYSKLQQFGTILFPQNGDQLCLDRNLNGIDLKNEYFIEYC